MTTISNVRKAGAWLFIMLFVFGTSLNAYAQNLKLSVQDKPLSFVLKEITSQTGYKFVYSDALNGISEKITFSYTSNNEPIDNVLNKLFAGKGFSFKIEGKQIILTPSDMVPDSTKPQGGAVRKPLTGKITDEQGEPLPGVTIQNKATGKFTATEMSGAYFIDAKEGDLLSFSSIGMTDHEMVVGKKNVLNAIMKLDVVALGDVVVTGYQNLSKDRSTGSYAVVTSEKINTKLQTNIMDRLEGMVAGLNSNRGRIEVRGISTLNGTATPLYVVDGVPFEGVPGENTSVLNVLSPADIVNVTILKDATAASIYGARSANGVIVITTRSGQVGKTKVSYNGTVNFQGMADRDYKNRMNSSELIDYILQVNESSKTLTRTAENMWQHDIQSLILDLRENKITQSQFDKALIPYRSRDRYDQVMDEFLRKTKVVHQHNLSFGGGSDIYKYNISANYTGTAPYEKAQYEHRVGFNLKNTFNFFKWLQVDAGIMGSNSKSDYDNGISGLGYLDNGPSSFFMLRDENGAPIQMYCAGGTYKSQQEIDRLKSLGLQDETYYPVNELGTQHYTAKTNYLNINIGARFKIIEGLTATIRYQTEKTTGYTKQYKSVKSYEMRRMINDATQIDSKGVKNFNVPVGGSLLQRNIDNYSYTVRGQVDYNKKINKEHEIQALVGGEVRKALTYGNGFYRLGYDDDNLGDSKFNALDMVQMLSGTQAIGGTFSFNNLTPNLTVDDRRFVSFYANASWNFREKLSVTGSIRIDQSNLFGTDPKSQYRPLWSFGVHYVLLKNYRNWLDRLVVRATYGINGNVPKGSGPYLIARAVGNNIYSNEPILSISSPSNSQLRWEKTDVINIGVDFNMLKNRLYGSFEYYSKNTADLLGAFSINPTLGWSSVNMNFGSMYNRGVEITLGSLNVNKKDFRWATNFTFSYNKNKITRIEASNESAYSYFSELNNREGYPMDALFSIRYKGLDERGNPVAYFADGSECVDYRKLTKEDLVYSGTYNPPYNAALTNTLTYKGIELGFMFVYAGGHVMRDVAADQILILGPNYAVNNTDRDMMKYWKSPGDEFNPDCNPANMIQSSYRAATENLWRGADKHVRKGDFIKLRDLTLAYNLPATLLKKTNISGVKVSFQARNLWYWTANDRGLDPEVWSGSSLTPGRGKHMPAEFTFGLNLNF